MKRENAPALNKEQLENVEKVGGVLSLGKAESQKPPITIGLALEWASLFATINENWQLTDYLEIIIIDLQKVVKAYQETPNDEVLQWMLFLDNPEKKNEKILNIKWFKGKN